MKRNLILLVAVLGLLIFAHVSYAARFDESNGKKIVPGEGERKKLNTFFSNFSEVFLEPFAEGKIKNDELIRFAIIHNYRNNEKAIEKLDQFNGKLSDKKVEASIEKYFGKLKFEHKSIDGFEYSKNYYKIPYADGEALSFAQVSGLIDIGDGYFVAYVDIYNASPGFTGDVHAAPSTWKKDDGAPSHEGAMRAVIKKTGDGEKTRYILIEYLKK